MSKPSRQTAVSSLTTPWAVVSDGRLVSVHRRPETAQAAARRCGGAVALVPHTPSKQCEYDIGMYLPYIGDTVEIVHGELVPRA